MVQYGGLALPLGVAVMVLLCLALALFPSLFGWMVARWARTYGPAALLLAPIAWVATEILRAHTLFDFSWCLLGYSQHANLPTLQIARYAAVYGVSFVVAAVSSALAFLLLERRRAPRTAVLLATAGLLAVVWMHGEWRLGKEPAEVGRVRVGLVQASIAQDEKWDAAHAWANVDRHLALTRRAVGRRRAARGLARVRPPVPLRSHAGGGEPASDAGPGAPHPSPLRERRSRGER